MEESDVIGALKKFGPDHCVFVLSADKQGNPNGMISAWNTKASYDPPMIAVCLAKEGNTQRLIQESKEFVVVVPNMDILKHVEFFGSRSGSEVEKFKESGIETFKATHVNVPLIKDATINFECKLESVTESGDCYLFLGKVLAANMDSSKKVLYSYSKVDGKRKYIEI